MDEISQRAGISDNSEESSIFAPQKSYCFGRYTQSG